MSSPQVSFNITDTVQQSAISKKRAACKRHSNYFITLNANRPTYSLQDDLAEAARLKKTLAEMFGNAARFREYVRFNKGGNWDDIVSADIQSAVEKGAKTNKVHAHLLVKISHRTSISLDFSKIRSDFKEKMGVDDCYMQARLISRTAVDDIDRYLYKEERKM
jgi:hypothetical protein